MPDNRIRRHRYFYVHADLNSSRFSLRLQRRQGLSDSWALPCTYVAAPNLVKLRQKRVCACQCFDSADVGFELCSRDGENGDVVGQVVEIGSCATASEAQRGPSCVHHLRDHSARGPSHGWRIVVFDLLGRFGENKALTGIHEQNDDVGGSGVSASGA